MSTLIERLRLLGTGGGARAAIGALSQNDCRQAADRIEALESELDALKAEVERSLKACEMIVAVKHCMMLASIHDVIGIDEILANHGVDLRGPDGVQELAHQAQALAEQTIAARAALADPARKPETAKGEINGKS